MEHGLDGFTIERLIEKEPGLTYDDFLLLPGHIYFSPQVISRTDVIEFNLHRDRAPNYEWVCVSCQDVSTSTRITRNIRLKCPFVSSPMDTVS